MENLISIVITTKNEEKNIENCLISIMEQTYKNYEIVVVDNQSSDKTKEIALKYTINVFDMGPERSAQRNYGINEKSNGKFVMYIDADMILSPTLLEDCLQYVENNELIALYIPEIILGKGYFSKVRRFERTFYNGTVIDAVRFVRKEEFKKIGGFDLNLNGPEDWDLDKRLKPLGKIGLLSKKNINYNIKNWKLYNFILERGINPKDYGSVIYHNEADFNLKKYLRKKTYYSKSFDNYINKWGKDDADIKKQFGFWYRYFIVFIENGKWIYLIKHPFLTIGLYFLRILVGFVYITRLFRK